MGETENVQEKQIEGRKGWSRKKGEVHMNRESKLKEILWSEREKNPEKEKEDLLQKLY